MRRLMLSGVFGFGLALTWEIGRHGGGLALLPGVVLGLALVALLYALHRANERITAGMVAGVGGPLERATRQFRTNAPAGTRYGALSQSSGHPDGEWRVYPSTVRRYKRLAAGDAAAVAGPIEIEHRQPHHAPTAVSDVGVPALQALITATIAALLVGCLALLAGRGDALRIVGGVFVVTLAASWVWRLGVVDSLLQTVERVTQVDIDGDGQIGAPHEHELIVNAQVARETVAHVEGERARQITTLSLLTFWQKCHTVGTSSRSHGARPGTQALEDFERMRGILFDLGLARWKDDANHRAGWIVTTDIATGARILKEHVQTVRGAV